MKNLFDYLESKGIFLIRNNSKLPILSIERVIQENLKLQIPKSELMNYIKNFLDEMYENKLGIEHNGLGNFRCVISRDVFLSLYSLKIKKTKNNTPQKKLQKEGYTDLEKRIYDFISKQNITPQKYLQNFFEVMTVKSRNELNKTLKKLQKDFWIVKVGQDKKLGPLWKVAWRYDGRLLKRVLKLSRSEAIEHVVHSIVKSSDGISRPQIKKLLKSFATGEEIDKAVTALILNNQIEFHKTIVVNGKKALVAQKK